MEVTTDPYDYSTESLLYAKAREVAELREREAQPVVDALPSLRDFAKRYREEYVDDDFAPTTRRDRASALREDGPLVAYFGDVKLDAITSETLHEWWYTEIKRRGLARRTGRGYVDVLSSVLRFARARGVLIEDGSAQSRPALP
jgi:hypothetical protein